GFGGRQCGGGGVDRTAGRRVRDDLKVRLRRWWRRRRIRCRAECGGV
ncbi:LOW QUALITY PROTEIN: PE family protein, partial [Mycobacterium tuberculosis EAS054]